MSDEQAEIARRDSIAAVLADQVPDAPAWRIEWLRSYCEGEHGSVVPVAPADRKAAEAFRDRAARLRASLDAVPSKMLPPEIAAEIRHALDRANLVLGARIVTRTAKGRRNWQAATVVAVCRALWTAYRQEPLPRWFNEAETHPFMAFLADMLDALDVGVTARGAADS